MNQTKTHTALLNEVLEAIGSFSFLRVWKNNTGVALSFSGHVTRFGLKGSADILGILRGGKFLAIEIKTGNAIQTEHQKSFQKMIESLGGIYWVIRSKKEALERISSLGL